MLNSVRFESSLEGLAAFEYDCKDPKVIMCCIHGIGEHFGRYERMAGMLEKYGIKMIGMDLRGHGRTKGRTGHCAPRTEVLSDIDAMIKYAMDHYPDLPIVLYGHSMGGNIGLDYRYRGYLNSVPKAYVISAPWVKLVRDVPGILLAAVKLMSKIAPKLTIGSSVDETILGNPESVGPYKEDPLVHEKISMLTSLEGFTIGNEIYDGTWMKQDGGKDRPLLLMHGTDDRICDIAGSRSVARREGEICEYVEWEGYYHEIHNGGPSANGDEVIGKIGQWITKTVLR